MASIGTVSVKLYEEPRPCEVTINLEVHKALFHCWAIRQYVKQAILIGEASGQITCMYAIVEMDDGSICEVEPYNVRFLDSAAKFNEYAWEDQR